MGRGLDDVVNVFPITVSSPRVRVGAETRSENNCRDY